MTGDYKRAFRSAAMFGVAMSLLLLFTIVALCLFGDRYYPRDDLSKPFWSNSILIWMNAVSNVVFGIGALFVSVLLVIVQRRRPDLPFNWALPFLAVFLFAFGIVSLLAFIGTWHLTLSILWFGIGLKIFAAVTATITGFLFWRILPDIIALPTVNAVVAEREARATAEAELRAKRDVVKQAGHELRGPLTPILAALDQIHGETETITLLRRSVQQMASSITHTLDSFGIGGTEVAKFREAAQPIERIVVVEDHADTARAFASLLARAGYKVEQCDSAATARDTVRAGDFLLCDIGLPDGDGWELMGELSARGVTGIAISGYATAEDKCRSAASGFLAHLTKPVDFSKVIQEIKRHQTVPAA